MEAFSLLKYWKSTGAGAGDSGASLPSVAEHTTIATTPDSGDADDGPFFDLELAGEDVEETEQNDDVLSDCTNLTESSLSLSPSDELFFKGRVLPVESPEIGTKPQFGGGLLKSATKFRVFTLGFKKSKQSEVNVSPAREKVEESLTVKFEEVPIMSLFSRDNCSRNSGAGKSKNSDDVMQKYLKKVKPHYVRISKRYSGKPSAVKAAPGKEISEIPVKQGNFPAGLKVVCKHLVKSRSASSAVAAAPSPAVVLSRRDDSLLQQEDGIQSAILHCKRSFQSSRD